MKKLLLLLLLCPLLCLGQHNYGISNHYERYDIYRPNTVKTKKKVKHKSDFHQFELSMYAGAAFYGLPEKDHSHLLLNYENQVVDAAHNGSAFKLNFTAAFYFVRNCDIGISLAENNLTYSAKDQQGVTVYPKYAQPLINYGIFSNYYFGHGSLQPFAGAHIALLMARVQEDYQVANSQASTFGFTLGINAGLRYKITKRLGVNVMEQINENVSSSYLDMMTYSTLVGLSVRF